jgi:predicted nuclease with TOPRIM domain
MSTAPYGSPPPSKPLPADTATLQMMVMEQRRRMEVARRDITELKDLAKRLNTKYESEQRRMRQLHEAVTLSNANARNLAFQNEDLRERLQHIEAHGVTLRHEYKVRKVLSAEERMIVWLGAAVVVGMGLTLLWAAVRIAG